MNSSPRPGAHHLTVGDAEEQRVGERVHAPAGTGVVAALHLEGARLDHVQGHAPQRLEPEPVDPLHPLLAEEPEDLLRVKGTRLLETHGLSVVGIELINALEPVG